ETPRIVTPLYGAAASDQKSAWAADTAATTEAAAIAALIPSLERIGFSQILLVFVMVRRRRARWVSRCSCWPRTARFSMRIIRSLSARATRFSQGECAFFSLFKILRCSTALAIKLIDTGWSQPEHESAVGQALQAGAAMKRITGAALGALVGWAQ